MTTGFICKNIGQVDDGVRIEQKRDIHGAICFRASTTITSILGSDPALTQGPTLEGLGVTEKHARERLEKELRDFNDSLWD
jgi:hypothetical protein